MYSEFAILIHSTHPFTDDVISKALWQCMPLQHDRLLQMIVVSKYLHW